MACGLAVARAIVVRVVSEILESNGSSSMASVCGASLAMMDAGVPLKAPVAGVAMGLVLEGKRFKVLTDILGDEDHLGDMDFKVAGTKDGVTTLQMDIKVEGITPEIMKVALAQARDGRLHILGEMAKVIQQPREQMSEWAPSIITIRIDPEKIRDVIGKGGATIRGLCEETGCQINIAEDGVITIASTDGAKAEFAIKRINEITAEVEIGAIYEGPVTKLFDFGALVNLLPGKDGLLHISQIAHQRVDDIGPVHALAAAPPVEIAERALGGEIARARRRQRRSRRGGRSRPGGRAGPGPPCASP